jgi:hypothetical protein
MEIVKSVEQKMIGRMIDLTTEMRTAIFSYEEYLISIEELQAMILSFTNLLEKEVMKVE